MQDMGFLTIDGERIFVLYRMRKYGISLKLRKPAKDYWLGTSLNDESEFLKEHPELLKDLKDGKVIEF